MSPSAGSSEISTHAPHAGSDQEQVRGVSKLPYFNPRSPCGERPRQSNLCTSHATFQPTLPMRGATKATKNVKITKTFQPTLPMRGATSFFSVTVRALQFQPTLPMRGATLSSGYYPSKGWNFNPRSPCGERLTDSVITEHLLIFQPTLPMRGATHATNHKVKS